MTSLFMGRHGISNRVLLLIFLGFLGGVIILKRGVTVEHGPKGGREVALTFDDGPNPPYTDQILKVLRRHHAKATFFVIGQNALAHPETIRQLLDIGHEVGNHSYSHPSFRFLGVGNIIDEIRRNDAVLERLGVKDAHFRSPFGSSSFLLNLVLWRWGRKNILFDVDSTPPDYARPAPMKIAESILSRIHPGAIIDLHDGEGTNVEGIAALDHILIGLESRGLQAVTVNTLLSRNEPNRNASAVENIDSQL